MGGVGVKSDVVNGTMERTSFDDSCEGLKRTALSSSLRDLSDTGETAKQSYFFSINLGELEHPILLSCCLCGFIFLSVKIQTSYFWLTRFFLVGVQGNVVAGTVLVLWTVPWK